jgi:regulation of enolase protein 1 (concanavalin A-like superfamily)
MAGMMVFRSVQEAIRAGFEVYDRTSDGYLVRTKTARGWALALVRSSAHR